MEGTAFGAAGSACLISSTYDGVTIIDRGKPENSKKSLLQTTLTTANPRLTFRCDARTSYLSIGTCTEHCF